MQTGGAKVQTTNLPISNNFLEFLQKLSFFNNNNKKPYWLLITSPQKESSKASAAQQQAEKAK